MTDRHEVGTVTEHYVIEGDVVAVDGVPVCSHRDERIRSFVPGRGPRERCARCGEVTAGVAEPRALTGGPS